MYLTGGVDFNTTTLTATFDSGMTMSSVNISIITDNIVERKETFNVMLLPPSTKKIRTTNRDNAVVSITDSNGEALFE